LKCKERQSVMDRIIVNANLAQLTAISRFVTSWARDAGFDEERIQDIELAVEELCTNIIQHGYSPGSSGTIEIRCEDEGEWGSIYILDRAPHFDPCSWSSSPSRKDISTTKPGGRGIAIVNRLVDGLEYEENPDGGNCVRMIKKKQSN